MSDKKNPTAKDAAPGCFILVVLVVIVGFAISAAFGGDDEEPQSAEAPQSEVAAPATPTTPPPRPAPPGPEASARERLEYRFALGGKGREVVRVAPDLVILADLSDPDPSDIAVKSLIRDYIRSGFTRPLSIRFDGLAFNLTNTQVASFEDEDAAGVVDINQYRLPLPP